MKKLITGSINLLLMLGLCLIAFGISANAATFVVNTTNDTQDATAGNGICADASGACSLRAAISEANALAGADTITLPAGTYTETLVSANENLNAGGDFDIASDITINGAGAGTTIVQANAAAGAATERVFHIRGVATTSTLTVTIDGLTVRNGRYAVNTFGAGIRIDQGTAHQITLSNLDINNNLNDTSGGGISISGPTGATVINITNCNISNNKAGSSTTGTSAIGGGIQINSISTVNITNSTINSNQATTTIATSQGGGIGVSTTAGVTLAITGGTINNNTNTNTNASAVGYGGGMFFRDGSLTINGTTISGNSTSGPGGGISYFGSTATARTLTLTNVTITNNTANNTNESGAGGINFDVFGSAASTLTISGSNISNNTSTAGTGIGGGIYNWSEVGGATTNITNSTISGNQADFGGGMLNESDGAGTGTVTMTGSTVSGNTSTGNGGGIYNFAASTTGGLAIVNATNSTVSGNNSGASGAGITNEIAAGATATGPTVNLDYTTIASNTAVTNGGGLQRLSGAINLKNSIVADNTAATGPDIFGTITSQDYNHVENTSGGTFFADAPFALANDVTGTDPQLGALGNNGGPTQTQVPAMTSPVINTIPSGASECGTTVTTDQRGITRPAQTGCEKGAVEYLSPTAASASISGRVKNTAGDALAGVIVSLTDLRGNIRSAETDADGFYQIAGVESGGLYVVNVTAKNYSFSPQTITINENLADFDLILQQRRLTPNIRTRNIRN